MAQLRMRLARVAGCDLMGWRARSNVAQRHKAARLSFSLSNGLELVYKESSTA
jgi:hypothetical protein